MDSIADCKSEEKDKFYKPGELKGYDKGYEIGLEMAKKNFMKNLLHSGDLSITEIASLCDASLEFIVIAENT
jgi:hypothetical protein